METHAIRSGVSPHHCTGGFEICSVVSQWRRKSENALDNTDFSRVQSLMSQLLWRTLTNFYSLICINTPAKDFSKVAISSKRSIWIYLACFALNMQTKEGRSCCYLLFFVTSFSFPLVFRNVANTVLWDGIFLTNSTRLILPPVFSLFRTIWMIWTSKRACLGTLWGTC